MATLPSIQVESLRLFVGARAMLDEPTATCRWKGLDAIPEPADLDARLRGFVAERWSEDVFPHVQPCDWPGHYLMPGSPRDGIAAWCVALVVALQRMAGDPVGRGAIIHQGDGSVDVALPWHRAEVLRGALQMGIQQALLWRRPPSADAQDQLGKLHDNLSRWVAHMAPGGMPPSILRFAMAAQRRGLPLRVGQGVLTLGWGAAAQRTDSSFTGQTSNIAVRLARYKGQTGALLQRAGIPVPDTALAPSVELALQSAQKWGWPVVVKPSNLDQGAAVTTGIQNEAGLRKAFEAADKLSPGSVMVQKHVQGADHRILVVGGRMLMATRREPGGVTGDGTRTVLQLVEQVNADPRRGTDKRSLLITLQLDDEARACLAGQGLDGESVPEAGRFVHLRGTANISTGGTAVDVSEKIHPDNRLLAERATRIVGLDIAGVDLLCPDISRSWREVGGCVIEVNAQPGLRPHWLGDPGRDINGEIVDWMFAGSDGRIPTAAITGTNGKTTVARMLHHIWLTAGKHAGVCTTNGVWMGRDLITDKNLSGYPGGRMLLDEPGLEAAVIEMPRKGLLQFGHPCDRYDVAALLNVQDDHIGVDGIDTPEAMAGLKAEVLARARHTVVIGADDPHCLAVRSRAGAPRVILVARDADSPAMRQHIGQGGDAVTVQPYRGAPWIMVATRATHHPLMPLAEIPATMQGLLRHNETNALFAVAMAWAHGLPFATIRAALASFANTLEMNPGRYNFIKGLPYTLLLDFGHNPEGLRELCALVKNLPRTGALRLVSCNLGNRHKSHVDLMAPMIAALFDTVTVSADASYVQLCPDWAGDDPVANMLSFWRNKLVAEGLAQAHVHTEPDQEVAITRVLTESQEGDVVVLLCAPWKAMAIVRKVLKTSPTTHPLVD